MPKLNPEKDSTPKAEHERENEEETDNSEESTESDTEHSSSGEDEEEEEQEHQSIRSKYVNDEAIETPMKKLKIRKQKSAKKSSPKTTRFCSNCKLHGILSPH